MTDDMRAVALRRRLADELEHTGDLQSSEWRRALERVPRHIFIPEFFQWVDTDRGTHWRPVSETSDPDRWLELAYENTTW
ncbi:hypothetical protein [Actinomadura formosensis]|uniref:hypothetical protein n=1 Tax=Actinomadura formosensis TaxID=60706 RepID=UPI000832103A|nr:hypothetical protein [Actinomadura formosensis]